MLHRTSHRVFSLKIFYLGFPAEILGEKSSWRGGGFKIPCKFLRIFRSAPWGLSNRRAMITAVRRRALTSITSTALQWHFNNNRCHWCSFRSSGAVRMPTVRISRAPRFRRECIVCSCAVCIICSRASLPSLKIPPICTQFLIHQLKSLQARLRHRRSCVRRIIGNATHKSPSVSSSANCRVSGAQAIKIPRSL